jgi:hypothetical protein
MKTWMLLPALLAGCLPADAPFGSLVTAWAEETAELAGPPLTGAVVIAGLAAEYCGAWPTLDWGAVEVGDVLLASPLTQLALGSPEVIEVISFGEQAVQVTVAGARIMDRDSASLRFSATPGAAGFMLEVQVFDGKIEDQDDDLGEPFGRAAFTVQSDCEPGRNRVEGTARWTDLDAERTHTVALPADAQFSSGIGFSSVASYLPNGGTLSWVSRIDGQERTYTSYDGADVEIDDSGDMPVALWPGVLQGPGWIQEIGVKIQP